MGYQQTYNEILSFKSHPLRQGRQKIHPYPAMLHPLLVDYLINKYANKDSIVLDPFSGSGVTLLQAGLKGYQSYGFDVNPVALLISKVKTANYNLQLLERDIQKIKVDIKKCKKVDIPEIKNIDYWYSSSVQDSLGRIRYCLKNNQYSYCEFLETCFALICRDQSYTRKGEFKRYRMKADELLKRKDETLKHFFCHLDTMLEIIKDSNEKIVSPFHFFDTSENIDQYHLKYDLIITSPPYGDSRTTVAYGEFSSFALEWIKDFIDISSKYSIDRQSVGKKRILKKGLLKNKPLSDTLALISKQDESRSADVLYFFNEYFIILENILNRLPENGKACYVVGNRRVKGIEIPTDQITAEMMVNCGMSIEQILIRDISNKVMPLKNSPTNKTGEKDKTISLEYIIMANKK